MKLIVEQIDCKVEETSVTIVWRCVEDSKRTSTDGRCCCRSKGWVFKVGVVKSN